MFSTFKMLNGLFNLSREIDSLKMNIPLPTRDIGKMRLIWFSRRQWWYVCRLHAHKHPIDSLFKALDTFGYCQRPVYSNMHKIINLWNCLLILSSMLQESNAIKTTLVPQICMPIIKPLSENYVTSEGAVSFNVLYYQQLPTANSQVNIIFSNYQ